MGMGKAVVCCAVQAKAKASYTKNAEHTRQLDDGTLQVPLGRLHKPACRLMVSPHDHPSASGPVNLSQVIVKSYATSWQSQPFHCTCAERHCL